MVVNIPRLIVLVEGVRVRVARAWLVERNAARKADALVHQLVWALGNFVEDGAEHRAAVARVAAVEISG